MLYDYRAILLLKTLCSLLPRSTDDPEPDVKAFFLPLLITVIRPSTYFTLFPWLIFILCLWIHDIPVNRNIQRIESKRILE